MVDLFPLSLRKCIFNAWKTGAMMRLCAFWGKSFSFDIQVVDATKGLSRTVR